MSRLAHAVFGAPGFEAEKRHLATVAHNEILEAKRAQVQLGLTWSEAIRYINEDRHADDLAEYYHPYD